MSKPRSIHRSSRREFWPAMLAYVAIMFLLWPLLPKVHNDLLKIALAMLPMVPLLFVVRAMVRLVLRSDELEQRIHLIALAVAATLVSLLSLIGGFLVAGGIIRLDGTILLGVWPALVMVYSLARGWASRRYGGDGVICDDGITLYWRLWLVALVMGAVAGLGRHRMSDDQFGMLCGMSAASAVWGLVLALLKWNRRRKGNAA